MKSHEFLRKAKAAGWIVDRIEGSHHIMRHPDKNYTVAVPVHKGKDLRKRVKHKLLKQLGLRG